MRSTSGIVRRSLLAAWVGVSMTLICQGHDHGDHRIIPHLSILGEPDELHEGDIVHDSTIEAHTPSGPNGPYRKGDAGASTLLINAPIEPFSEIITIGAAVLDQLPALTHPFSHFSIQEAGAMASQTNMRPEAPPPRF